MSGVVDLLVRLLGENEGAVRAVRQVGEEVDKTDRKVEESSGRLQKWGSVFGSALAGIGSVVGGFQAGEIFGNLTNVQGKLSDALQRVNMPTSGADLAKSILEAGKSQAQAASATPTGFLRQLGDYITGKSGPNPFQSDYGYDSTRQALEVFKGKVLQNPELALAALRSGAFGEQTPQFQQVYSDWATRAMKSSQFTKDQAGNTINNTSNVNVNVTSGVGDPRQIGADVYSALDSYQRLNTHLQAPYPATGYMGR